MSEQVPSWDERLNAVKARFPSTAERCWDEARQDPMLMGALIREVLRSGHKRRGQQPLLDRREGMERLRQLWGDDYATLPFAQAFSVLAGTRSRSQLVALIKARSGVELSRTQVHRYLSGEAVPSGRVMEAIAKAFHKPPTYFHEYRLGLLVGALMDYLDAPEATAGLVHRLERREA